jgi:hypothetical protein
MPHKNLYYGVMAFVLAALAGCQRDSTSSSSIADQFLASGSRSVNLASAVPGTWDRVCILGPYSNNAAANGALGFNWPAESLTSIKDNDGISLLIFVRGKTVVSYVEQPRNAGDFTNLAGRCFLRNSAKFKQVSHPKNGWVGLYPENEA